MKIDKDILEKLSEYTELFEKINHSGRARSVTTSQRKTLLVIYNLIVGKNKSCTGCSDNGIIRLALWYKQNTDLNSETEEETVIEDIEEIEIPAPKPKKQTSKKKK